MPPPPESHIFTEATIDVTSNLQNLQNTVDITNFKNAQNNMTHPWTEYKIEFYTTASASTPYFSSVLSNNTNQTFTLDMPLNQITTDVSHVFKIRATQANVIRHTNPFVLPTLNLSDSFSLTPISVPDYSLLFKQNNTYIYLDSSTSIENRFYLSFIKAVDETLVDYKIELNDAHKPFIDDPLLGNDEYYVYNDLYTTSSEFESIRVKLSLTFVDKRSSTSGQEETIGQTFFIVHKCDFNNFNDFNINPISNINNFHTTKLRFNITNDYISFTYDGTNYKTESLKNTFQPNPFSITPKNNLISYLKLKTNQYLGESLSIIDAIDDAILLEREDNIADDTHVLFPVKSYKLYNSGKYLVVSSDTVSFTSIGNTDAEKQTASWTELNYGNTWNTGGYMMLYHDITGSSDNNQFLYAENNTLKVKVQTSVPTEYPAIEDYLWIFDNGRVFELNNVQESAIISIDNIDNYNIVHGKNHFSFQTKNVLNGISSILSDAVSSEQNVSSKYKTLTVNVNLKASVSCKVQ